MSKQNNRVFVLSNTRKPLMPCHPARARELLKRGRASVFRRQPFTIILHDRDDGETQPIQICTDPGSKITGMAIRIKGKRGWKCVFGLDLVHRGQQIVNALRDRAAWRRARRQRNTRYRPPRWSNRRRPAGWLPPSLRHRIDTTLTWTQRFLRWTPVSDIFVETARFDTQKARDSGIAGKQYQQGRLYNTHQREYLLYQAGHKCQYCHGHSNNPNLEVDHIYPRSRGGSDNLDNLTIACRICNHAKGDQTLTEWAAFLAKSRNKVDHIRVRNARRLQQGKPNDFRDMAAMNATRYQLRDRLIDTGYPVEEYTGADTKLNRTTQGYRKGHWIDAACLGSEGGRVYIPRWMTPLQAITKGHGSRQMTKPDRFGFPRTKPKQSNRVYGFKTGDLVKLISLYYKGIGRIVTIRQRGDFDIYTRDGKRTFNHRYFRRLQLADGYDYVHQDGQEWPVIFDITRNAVSIYRRLGYQIHQIKQKGNDYVAMRTLRVAW